VGVPDWKTGRSCGRALVNRISENHSYYDTEMARRSSRATLLAHPGEVYLIRLSGPASSGKVRVLNAWIPAL
jgi:hypothetical protein